MSRILHPPDFLSLSLLLFLLPSPIFADDKMGPYLREFLERSSDERFSVWIFFDGKAETELARLQDPRSILSERSVRRRMKSRPGGNPVDFTDLPVSREHIDAVSPHLLRLRRTSRWFNAVSAEIGRDQIQQVILLPFVKSVELVQRYRNDRFEQEESTVQKGPPILRRTGEELDYGSSFAQLDRIGVPQMHAGGNYAQGVMIGLFDNGFKLLGHEAFDSLDIVATYDFVENKIDVTPSNPSYGGHGVNTLSVIGGYSPGSLIGPAFRASYVLARTENDSSETPVEEDNWVAGIEWADSIGVDVTSTSLVYRGYDPPFTGWTWEDMDGGTTLITRAADMAASKGIIVVNAAGNYGDAPAPGQNTLGAPADGDSVVAVGAVDQQGLRGSFSSVGPTASNPPRIKPDVMAPGVGVWCASSSDPAGYTNAFRGTSFACPLAAGVAALLIQAHPDATPFEIIAAMRQTAGNASGPDNFNGWGILNAASAHQLLGSGGEIPTAIALRQNYPNPFNSSTTLQVDLPTAGSFDIEIFNILGQRVRSFPQGLFPAGHHRRLWDGRDSRGGILPSGIYIYRVHVQNGSADLMMEGKAVLIR